MVRANTMVIKETQYVDAARAIGASDLRIIFRHIVPGCTASYTVLTTGLIGVAIITESALGFLGLGIPPPLLGERCCPTPWLLSISLPTSPSFQESSLHWRCSRSASWAIPCATCWTPGCAAGLNPQPSPDSNTVGTWCWRRRDCQPVSNGPRQGSRGFLHHLRSLRHSCRSIVIWRTSRCSGAL